MIEIDLIYLAVAAMAWVVTLAGAAAWAWERGRAHGYNRGYNTAWNYWYSAEYE